MPNMEDIKQQISAIDGVDNFFNQKELEELSAILRDDEVIKKALRGSFLDRVGLLLATDKRAIFVYKDFLGSLKMEDFAYENIAKIQSNSELFMGEILIYPSENRAKICDIQKEQLEDFVNFVKSNIQDENPQTQNTKEDDWISKLERLNALKEKGVLSEYEFLLEKNKIMNER